MTKFCQCCLNKGDDQVNMSSPVNNQGILEVYEEMLQYSTGIQLLQDDSIHYICNICICRLRESCIFKNQVQETQSRLTIKSVSTNIKEELGYDEISIKDYNSSDDDYIYSGDDDVHNDDDDVSDELDQTIKHENESLEPKKIYRCFKCPKRFNFSTLSEKLQHTKEVHKRDLTCEMCHKTYATTYRKKEHIRRVHLKEKNYICNPCNESFFNITLLNRHRKKWHSDGQIGKNLFKSKRVFKCWKAKCQKLFDSRQELDVHRQTCKIKKVHKKRIGKLCPRCGVIIKPDQYDLHVKECDPTYICPHCGKTFKTYRAFYYHSSRYKDDIECKICKKTMKKDLMQIHMKRDHKQGFTLKCPICLQGFNEYDVRRRHLVEVHGEKTKEYPCNQCERVFNSSSKRGCHIRRDHLMERKHECDLCGARFFSSAGLRKHSLVHATTFECNICNKSFEKKSLFKEHRSTHRSDRKYHCYICGDSFKDQSTRDEHFLTHK